MGVFQPKPKSKGTGVEALTERIVGSLAVARDGSRRSNSLNGTDADHLRDDDLPVPR
jgi:hypothetical protein